MDAKLIVDERTGDRKFMIPGEKELHVVPIDVCMKHPDICFDFQKSLLGRFFSRNEHDTREGTIRKGIALIGPMNSSCHLFTGQYIKLKENQTTILLPGTLICQNVDTGDFSHNMWQKSYYDDNGIFKLNETRS